MKIVVFGLTISSSWGNGHATLWRGLVKALARRGHRVVFFEHDASYYRENRDLHALEDGELVLFSDWAEIAARAAREIASADVAIVTSYCPDALAATAAVLDAPRALRVFYDLDTPVTLSRLKAGEPVRYVGPDGLGGFDLVLSYTGGGALDALRRDLGARKVAPLYGHVDPDTFRPAEALERFRADLSYLGTYAADRQAELVELFVEPARARAGRRFVLAGAQYPQDFPWTENIWFVRHLPPAEHPGFYASSRLTLNITRAAMAAMGWCPSGRLFEATASGAAVVSDDWEGLDTFFEPGREIVTVRTRDDMLAALDLPDAALRAIAEAGRARTLRCHSSDARARDFEAAVAAAKA